MFFVQKTSIGMLIIILIFISLTPSKSFALSDFEAVTMVNSETNLILSDDGGGSDVSLTFGETLSEQLLWNNATQRFMFTDDIEVQGEILATQNITINSNNTASDASITFGNSLGTQLLQFNNNDQKFEFSTGLRVNSGDLEVVSLSNCDSIDTTISGLVTCGSDDAVFEVNPTEATVDYDSLTGSTIRYLSATSANRPSDVQYIVRTVGIGNLIEQVATNGASRYYRTQRNGIWSNWELIASESKVAEIAQSFDDIDKNIALAEDGDGAKTIKVMPVGTNVASQVVSHADGNVIYIKRVGDTTYSVLDRLDKHEVGTFTASQGDRIYSLKGDSVISNGFGTVAWMSMALAGEEFYTYVARNASVANPAHLYIATFGIGADITILENGAAYDSFSMIAESIQEVDLDNIAEYQITSNQPIVLWYIGNDNTVDAKPLPPVSSDLLWFNTAANVSLVPRISALYTTTNITINYRDGTQETAVVNPGVPFTAKYNAGYAQYAANGGAIITADGIISGANAADADGLNGTAWYSKDVASQHFFLPVSAEHISFVCQYETDIVVRNELDAVVTTLNATRGATVSSNQSYPSAVKYNLPGGDGEGYSFEASTPCNAVFDSNEPGGFAGDETVLLGGKLPFSANPIYRDTFTGQDVQLEINNGTVQINGL